MSIDRMNLHLISDATGETLNAIARATTVQFDHVDIIYHRWSLIRSAGCSFTGSSAASRRSQVRCCPPWSIAR
jgi:regulator of PEP synthase PpsR (kinase-PPPase family)